MGMGIEEGWAAAALRRCGGSDVSRAVEFCFSHDMARLAEEDASSEVACCALKVRLWGVEELVGSGGGASSRGGGGGSGSGGCGSSNSGGDSGGSRHSTSRGGTSGSSNGSSSRSRNGRFRAAVFAWRPPTSALAAASLPPRERHPHNVRRNSARPPSLAPSLPPSLPPSLFPPPRSQTLAGR